METARNAIPNKEDNLGYNLGDLAGFDLTGFDPKHQDLVNFSRDNVQLLLNRVFALPKVTSKEGTMVILPLERYITLPRALPLPKPKVATRWEKFAKEKGIVKKKRSRMVWDDNQKDWAPRWGARSVKKTENKTGDWLIEVPANSNEDPFEKKQVAKQLQSAKQKLREMRNKFESTGDKLPSGISHIKAKRGKEAVFESMKRAQKSTGSMGKFDKKVNEEVKPHKKTKIIATHSENEATQKILQKILSKK